MVRRIVFLFFLLFSPLCAYGESLIDWIIQRNPELQELRKLNSSILSNLKVEAKANAGYGQLTQEGTSTVEKAETRYFIGITASLPLISKAEATQKKIEYYQKERQMRQELSELLRSYTEEITYLKNEKVILDNLYNEIVWIGKRVEAGVDNQKEYNQRLNDYNTRRRDYEKRMAALQYLKEKILSYVDSDSRKELESRL
jgi:hypothetical protein